MRQREQFKIGILGSGTAGLISAILLRRAFPTSEITVISSSKIGIVGVGEGSTEHWRQFMELCQIPLLEMIRETEATHKYGLRFENWSDAHPDYFHSISGGDESIFAFGLMPMYMGFIEQNMLLTNSTGSSGIKKDKISRPGLHRNTNQFHFDTFKLNSYLTKLCFERQIIMIDGDVLRVECNSANGEIESIHTDNGDSINAHFWIDASGFSRRLLGEVAQVKWKSFSDYLLVDSAIAFPTPKNENNKIHPYTRSRAMSSGWVWEIPTLSRRGNGYVYSSKHISDDKAIEEVSSLLGFKVDPARSFKFDPGYIENVWQKNCCAVGLASSFVEPIEATSIGSTIQQVLMLIPLVASYSPGNKHMQKSYNDQFAAIMDNILSMVRLHYITDKTNTQFWIDARHSKINDSLQSMLDLWSECIPSRYYDSITHYSLFKMQHFLHVAQGQNVLNRDSIDSAIARMALVNDVNYAMDNALQSRSNHELVDHRQALEEIILHEK